jgi:hypothetical protein
VCGMLFSRLRDYDGGKSAFEWKRESADMGAILESMLTAGDTRKKVEKKLKRRAAVLLSHRFPNIQADIEELYEQRSRFVHGRFFAELADEIANPNDLPRPHFELLARHRELVRWAIAAYFHLAQLIKNEPGKYPGKKSVVEVLNQASGNSRIHEKVNRDVDEVLDLLG